MCCTVKEEVLKDVEGFPYALRAPCPSVFRLAVPSWMHCRVIPSLFFVYVFCIGSFSLLHVFMPLLPLCVHSLLPTTLPYGFLRLFSQPSPHLHPYHTIPYHTTYTLFTQ